MPVIWSASRFPGNGCKALFPQARARLCARPLPISWLPRRPPINGVYLVSIITWHAEASALSISSGSCCLNIIHLKCRAALRDSEPWLWAVSRAVPHQAKVGVLSWDPDLAHCSCSSRGAKQERPVCNTASASGSGSLLAFTPPNSTLAITAASTTPGSVTSALAWLYF